MPFSFRKFLQDARIGRGNLLPVEPLQPMIVDLFGNGQRQAALGEAQPRDDLGVLAALHKLVLAYHADVGYALCHALRNVVVAQIKHLEREVRRLYQQRPLGGTHLDVGLREQVHRVVKQTTFRLYCNT